MIVSFPRTPYYIYYTRIDKTSFFSFSSFSLLFLDSRTPPYPIICITIQFLTTVFECNLFFFFHNSHGPEISFAKITIIIITCFRLPPVCFWRNYMCKKNKRNKFISTHVVVECIIYCYIRIMIFYFLFLSVFIVLLLHAYADVKFYVIYTRNK